MNERDRVNAAADRVGWDVGIYRKYKVERVDGSSGHGGKHQFCDYFVLDWQHDPFAVLAARAYADACESRHPALAEDLRVRANDAERRWTRLMARTRCGAYVGDNDGTCPQLTCIRPKGHAGLCDNVSEKDDGP